MTQPDELRYVDEMAQTVMRAGLGVFTGIGLLYLLVEGVAPPVRAIALLAAGLCAVAFFRVTGAYLVTASADEGLTFHGLWRTRQIPLGRILDVEITNQRRGVLSAIGLCVTLEGGEQVLSGRPWGTFARNADPDRNLLVEFAGGLDLLRAQRHVDGRTSL